MVECVRDCAFRSNERTGDNVIDVTNIAAITEEIKLVCPIFGISSSGRIDFQDEATGSQKAAAIIIMERYLP